MQMVWKINRYIEELMDVSVKFILRDVMKEKEEEEEEKRRRRRLNRSRQGRGRRDWGFRERERERDLWWSLERKTSRKKGEE